ncbi:MAG: ester cyclase [Spirochaetales bacterium]|nr:ester cyclase [Spirochaetales bacterium]
MTGEDNKGVVRRVIEEAFNRGRVETLDELFTADYREHQFGMPRNIEGFKASVLALRAAFPDLRLTIEEMSAENDAVWVRMTARGTHGGEFMGLPPTARKIEVAVFDMCRLEKGRITDHWGVPDRFAIMQQIGALARPSPEA